MSHQSLQSPTVTFADVGLQSLIFDSRLPADQLILELLSTPWVQRLRQIRQTGNTNLVYMFSEHSRFGHSLGVAYLAKLLLDKLALQQPDEVESFREAVLAAALLHDVGHVAPGSHLAERIWKTGAPGKHERVTLRVIEEDHSIQEIFAKRNPNLRLHTLAILRDDLSVPAWTRAVISGSGWNADRGNWAMVDSAMCAVTYGRYNVQALIDAFDLSPDRKLVLHESRLDALTHFFVARDSMYRQVYQHRVLQAVDALSTSVVHRLRDLVSLNSVHGEQLQNFLRQQKIFADETMFNVLLSPDYTTDLPLSSLFRMTESWWHYHVECWCTCDDPVLADLSQRLCNRNLLKTVRLLGDDLAREENKLLLQRAQEVSAECGFDPRYYVSVVDSSDRHRKSVEEDEALVLLESGEIVPASHVEPLIAGMLSEHNTSRRAWIAVPREVKERLRRNR